jgi:hypothetical protein
MGFVHANQMPMAAELALALQAARRMQRTQEC